MTAPPLISVKTNCEAILCPRCDKRILDGNVLTSRVILIGANGSEAKCPRCKTMVKVPVIFTPPPVPKATPAR